jgi:Kelch motif
MTPRPRIISSAHRFRCGVVLVLVVAATASLGLARGRAAVSGPSASSVLAGVWHRLPPAPAPAATALTVSVWTGWQMVIFGRAYRKLPLGIDVAAAYTPTRSTWRRLTPLKGPAGNFQGEYHAVWTGKEMIDWGGGCCSDAFSTGWAFDPVTNRWRKLPSSPLAPSQSPTGVWTGHELIVLISGLDPDGKPYPRSLARIAAYNPVTNAWRRLAPLPALRFNADAVWDGHDMLLIGGIGASQGGMPGSLAKVGFAYTRRATAGDSLRRCPQGVRTSQRCGPASGC